MSRKGAGVSNFHLSTRKGDGYVKVALHGELDLAAAAGVTKALIAAVRRGPLILVDMSALNFIDVSGVSALAAARGQARKAGGDLHLCAPKSQALKILGVLQPADTFSVHASLADAVSHARLLREAVPPMRQHPHGSS
jgi:anti-sigma B factor antagonist